MTAARPPVRRPGKRRRRRFSLNGLAIQLSAFALSFTLVALLVVTGSQAAFVEENESVANYVPIGLPAEDDRADAPPRPSGAPVLPMPAPPTPAAPAAELEDRPAELPVESVALTDTDAGSAMFSDGLPLSPGDPLERCIEVAYVGTAEVEPVLLYAAGVTGDLAPWLDLTVEIGADTAGVFGTCTTFQPVEILFSGTMAGFAAAHDGHATGLTAWQPTGDSDARSFRFTVAVRDEPAAAGRSVSFGFTWESRGE